MESLNLDPLRRSLAALGKTLQQYAAAIAAVPIDDDLVVLARTAAIKNFEVAYEMGWKAMRRWMAQTLDDADLVEMTRRDMFREAARRNLIADPNVWFGFHAARNAGAHTYREEVADASLVAAQAFVGAGAALLAVLEKRSHA